MLGWEVWGSTLWPGHTPLPAAHLGQPVHSAEGVTGVSSPQSKGSKAHSLPPQAVPPAPRGPAVTVLRETQPGEFLSHTGTLYLLPRAAVTEFHKPGSLKEQNYILPQFWKARNSKSGCRQGCAFSAGSKGTCFSCFCPWLPAIPGIPPSDWSLCLHLPGCLHASFPMCVSPLSFL